MKKSQPCSGLWLPESDTKLISHSTSKVFTHPILPCLLVSHRPQADVDIPGIFLVCGNEPCHSWKHRQYIKGVIQCVMSHTVPEMCSYHLLPFKLWWISVNTDFFSLSISTAQGQTTSQTVIETPPWDIGYKIQQQKNLKQWLSIWWYQMSAQKLEQAWWRHRSCTWSVSQIDVDSLLEGFITHPLHTIWTGIALHVADPAHKCTNGVEVDRERLQGGLKRALKFVFFVPSHQ